MFVEKLRLDGKAALVVGGGAGGIGTNTSLALAEAGASIALADVTEERAVEAADEVKRRGGVAVPIACDVRDDAQIEAAVDKAIQELGRIDVVANVAGGSSGMAPWAPIIDYPDEAWEGLMKLNLGYVFRMGKLVVRHMMERGQGGSIVNIASVAGLRPVRDLVGYSVAKAGLVQLTKAMALEWASHGVRVNAIAPGGVATPRPLRLRNITREQYDAEMKDVVPLGRAAHAEDIAEAVLFLSSDMASYITGQVLVVDGGSTLTSRSQSQAPAPR